MLLFHNLKDRFLYSHKLPAAEEPFSGKAGAKVENNSLLSKYICNKFLIKSKQTHNMLSINMLQNIFFSVHRNKSRLNNKAQPYTLPMMIVIQHRFTIAIVVLKEEILIVITEQTY
jgi:hypothetical protein